MLLGNFRDVNSYTKKFISPWRSPHAQFVTPWYNSTVLGVAALSSPQRKRLTPNWQYCMMPLPRAYFSNILQAFLWCEYSFAIYFQLVKFEVYKINLLDNWLSSKWSMKYKIVTYAKSRKNLNMKSNSDISFAVYKSSTMTENSSDSGT